MRWAKWSAIIVLNRREEPPFDSHELAILRPEENRAIDQKNIFAPGRHGNSGETVGYRAFREEIILGPQGCATGLA